MLLANVVVVQSLSRVWLFVTPWTAACQAPLSFTISWSLLKFMLSRWCHPTIPPSVTPFFSCLQSFPASGSCPVSQLFTSGGQSVGGPASAFVLLMNIQDWFPLRLTGWISLQSKGLSRVFSRTTTRKQKHVFQIKKYIVHWEDFIYFPMRGKTLVRRFIFSTQLIT